MTQKLIEVWLEHKGDRIRLPFTDITSALALDENNNVVNLYESGDKLIRGNLGLKEFSYSSFIPDFDKEYSFIDNKDSPSGYEFTDMINKWREDVEPVRLILTETDINMPTRITSFSYGETDQSGSVMYEITLTEYPPIEPRKEAKSGEYEKAERRPRTEIKEETIKMNLGWEEKA